MAEDNAEIAAEKRIEFRIGINVGDIVVEDGDIFGDGVNVAARLEGRRNARTSTGSHSERIASRALLASGGGISGDTRAA